MRAATNAEQLGEQEEASDESDHASYTTEHYCVTCQLELSGAEAYAEHLLEKSHTDYIWHKVST